MELQGYLDRIGYTGQPGVDVPTLKAIHRRHLRSIPFENLDVLLGRRVDLDEKRIFDKLVNRRRGGWCYEMNGLFAWALREIGFPVTRLAGGVSREQRGDDAVGNHLTLLVEAEGEWLADVGFGDGLFEPVPLEEGGIVQRGFKSSLRQVGDGWWRFDNHQHGGAPYYDFRVEPASTEHLERQCEYLQTNELSGFTQTLTAQRQFDDRVETLRNSVRSTVFPHRVERWALASVDEFVTELVDVFGIVDPESASLWPKAEANGRSFVVENPELFQ